MDIQRKCFEESSNVNPDWPFKFDKELQQYIALDSEMELQVDEFNEHWDTFRAGWQAAKAQATEKLKGCVMDAQREAFELVVANELQNSLYHSVFFNESTGWYYCADDAPAGVQVFCCDLNSDFRIWKAAKAMEDGATAIVQDTVGHAIASGLTVTITAPNSGTFSNDLGVVNATTLEPLKNVASNPATGQYSVDEATGVYTFASADVGKKVYINFNYDVSTVGKSVAMDKIAMGPTPSFRLDVKLSGPDGQQFLLTLYKCVSSKLSLATKFDEFMQPEVEFKAQLDEYNRAFKLSEL